MQKKLSNAYMTFKTTSCGFDDDLIRDWRPIAEFRPLYYMAAKWLRDGDVHTYFSPTIRHTIHL